MNNLVNWNAEMNHVSCIDVMNELSAVLTDVSLKIENVIFNGPATIVFWSDGTKTVVKCNNDPYDKEKGLAMAIVKKFLGNEGNYYNVFRKWLNEQN